MLRNIAFKEVKADVRTFWKMSQVLVTWSLNPTSQNLKNLFFIIERSEAGVEFKQINSTPIPANGKLEYLDETAMLRTLDKTYYYRVKAIEINPCNNVPLQTIVSESVSLLDPPDLTATYIIEEHTYALRYIYGIPSLLFTKRSEGPKCDNCWDTVLKRVTKSNCTSCYGTGFLTGYYDPVDIWVDYTNGVEQTIIADWGERQAFQADIQFIDYPNLRIGDVILQCKPLTWWRVENVRSSTKNTAIILQLARLHEINRSDIETLIPIPYDRVDRLIKELRDRVSQPEF